MEERFKQAACADIAFIKEDGGKKKILLMQRCNTGFDDGYYELPGGHVEKDEDIYNAMIREIEEELLIKLQRKDIKLVHIMHHYTGKRLNFIFVSDKNINPIIGEKDKCSDLSWFDIDNLPDNTTEKVKRIILNIKNNILYDYM